MDKNFKAKKSGAANRLWFFAGLAVFLLLFFGLTTEIVNRRQVDKRISGYKNEIAQLKKENSALSDKISNWDESGELELNARVKLSLEKPGEQTIIINRADAQSDKLTAIKSNQEVINLAVDDSSADSVSNAEKWWEYFFQ